MPQIDQLAETFSSQAFWLLVFFGISFCFNLFHLFSQLFQLFN